MRTIFFAKWAVVVLFLLPPPGMAQDNRQLIDRARIPAEAEKVEQFVPDGWKVEEQLTGDLNGDSLPDYVLKLVEN